MKKYYYIFILFSLSLFQTTISSPIISFFFKPFVDHEKLTEKLKKPGKIAKHTLHGIADHPPITGICVLYSGYITSSDYEGEVIFPLKHAKPEIKIVITTELKPIPLFENTIHHWEFIPNTPTEMYTVSHIYNENSKSYEWHTDPVKLSQNHEIPLNAIIIIAKPKDIVVSLETQPTIKSTNLILPPIYVKKGINIIKDTSYLLFIRHFFKPTVIKGKREPLRLMTHIID